MGAIDLESMRERANGELAQADEALREAEAGAGIVELDQSQTGRLSRMDAMQQQAMSSGMVERLRLHKRKLQAALDRMSDGEYGTCCKCGNEIPAARLEVDVAAPFCAACQERIDARR